MQQQGTILETESKLFPDTIPVSTLIFDFLASRTVSSKLLLLLNCTAYDTLL
jgi:hypothetical protein